MKAWPRGTLRCVCGIKTKVTNLPQQACKFCLRLTAIVCKSDTLRVSCIVVTICVLSYLLFIWLFLRDPCFQWEIRKEICDDYIRGVVAGALCYALCIEQEVSLSRCLEDEHIKVFSWHDLVLKVEHKPHDSTMPAASHQSPADIWEGMTHDQLVSAFRDFFNTRLGIRDHSTLIERSLAFTDFNQDGQLHFGEVSSLWQLLHIQEFQILFIFQGNSIFPALNATCGRLYSYEQMYRQYLFDKSRTSMWDAIFKNRYRWSFPDWQKRIHIALGLLEYVYLSLEASGSKFYMCDFSPKNFGYSEFYEAKVSNVQGIISEAMLNNSLQNKRCHSNTDCVYGQLCRSSCNRETKRCTGIIRKPNLVHVCEVLVDYVLYDTPASIKWSFTHLILRCKDLTNPANDPSSRDVYQNLVLNDLTAFLWEQLKNEANTWLYPPTKPIPIFD